MNKTNIELKPIKLVGHRDDSTEVEKFNEVIVRVNLLTEIIARLIRPRARDRSVDDYTYSIGKE